MAGLIIPVIHFLNAGLAITLCCIAKKLSNSVSTNNAVKKVDSVPESIDFGTIRLPTNPMAYGRAIRQVS